jgi:hypothetical protein
MEVQIGTPPTLPNNVNARQRSTTTSDVHQAAAVLLSVHSATQDKTMRYRYR